MIPKHPTTNTSLLPAERHHKQLYYQEAFLIGMQPLPILDHRLKLAQRSREKQRVPGTLNKPMELTLRITWITPSHRNHGYRSVSDGADGQWGLCLQGDVQLNLLYGVAGWHGAHERGGWDIKRLYVVPNAITLLCVFKKQQGTNQTSLPPWVLMGAAVFELSAGLLHSWRRNQQKLDMVHLVSSLGASPCNATMYLCKGAHSTSIMTHVCVIIWGLFLRAF